MDEATLKNQPVKGFLGHDLVFKHLPAYAAYIRDNCLVQYVQEQLKLCRELDLPMLKHLKGISDADLVTMSLESNKKFLTAAAENTIKEHLERSLKLWVTDQLVVMKRDEITAEDINLAGYIRNKALVKFLSSYTADVNGAIEIVQEINTLTVESDIASTNVYIRLLKDRINEQAFFTEVLSNTTPGLNYIFDLKERVIKYANTNAVKFFGYALSEMRELGRVFIENTVYPDDLAITGEGLRRCSEAADAEVVTWEMRLKTTSGKYLWMRNYSSIYKRDETGAPIEMVGIILDIDTEKETADKLIFRERQLLEAQAQAQLGSFELDVETGKMNVTPQFKEIYELTDFDLSHLIDHVHPDDRSRVNENRNRAIDEGSLYDNEYRYLINGKEKVIWSRGAVAEKNGRKVLIGTAMDVTNRHRMLQELLESRDLYKQAQSLSHIGNWSWDLVTGKIEWSDELYNIYGLMQGAELTFEEIMTLYHADDISKIRENVQQILDAKGPSETYNKLTLKDGTHKILHAKTEVLNDATGKAYKMIGTIQDVTEKQALIDRLQASDILYKQAQAISHIGNWSWDLETKKLDWSEELYKIYELEPGAVDNSMPLAVNNHPQDDEVIRKTIRKSLITGEPFDFNYRIILKSGKMKTLNARGEIKTGVDNKPEKIYGTLQDITEQKLIEKRLKETQEFIQKITDTTPSIIAAYNIHTGKYSFINKAVEKQLGYPVSQIIKGGVEFFISIMHPDDLNIITEKNSRALEEANKLPMAADEPIEEFKYRLRNLNGEYRWFYTYGTVFERNENGQVESVLNVSIDITAQEEAEHELYEKNLQLQQSNTSLEEYAYVASHDLKEPLRKIVTFSDRMLTSQADTLNTDGKLYLSKIIDSSRRMQKMINDLLNVSTISGNKDYQMCDLNILLQDALLSLDHKIEELHAEVDADHLPTVSVVPSQFVQLFQNLVGNSLKFARKGVTPHIKITHSFLNYKSVEHLNLIKARKYLCIQLQDNGIGFDDQYGGKIFVIFQRLHGKADYDGTGIGLALCKKIVENHNGVISAKGKVNNGAQFTVIIPV